MEDEEKDEDVVNREEKDENDKEVEELEADEVNQEEIEVVPRTEVVRKLPSRSGSEFDIVHRICSKRNSDSKNNTRFQRAD